MKTAVPEKRFFTISDFRSENDGSGLRVSGYAAVFNSQSFDMGGWRELIAPGAFTKTLSERDQLALVSHDTDKVLGRRSAGTLTLTQDDRGLAFSVLLPDTSYARDLAASMARGDINQCSFGFRCISDDLVCIDQGIILRTLLECELFEISIVAFPAYPATEAQLSIREYLSGLGNYKPERLQKVFEKIEPRKAALAAGKSTACSTWESEIEFLKLTLDAL